MEKKIVINPKYEHLREYIESIPEEFDSLGEVMMSRRNILRKDSVENSTLIIKSFKRIYLTNRIRYSFFYPSKAQRAFDYGNVLLQKGFNTPAPIAYIEVKSYGLISESYFVSEYLDFEPLQVTVRPTSDLVSEWMRDFVAYTYRLHQNGIYHNDYNLGNVLFKKNDDRYEFALVDNNRMKFGPVSLHRGILNFAGLGVSVVDSTVLARDYANMRHTDEVMGIERLFHYKIAAGRKNRIKSFFKKLVKEFRASIPIILLLHNNINEEIILFFFE